MPGSSDADWLYARIYSHPEQLDEIIAHQLPDLLERLGSNTGHWFIRYRDQHDADHLRLRLRTASSETSQKHLAAVGAWAHDLRRAGLAGRLIFDTYYPEIGRYGGGATMQAAENVFVADSVTVSDQLRQLSAMDREVMTTMNMVGTVEGFLGSRAEAMTWLLNRSIDAVARPNRTVARAVIHSARALALTEAPGWAWDVTESWTARANALAAYRQQLPPGANLDAVLESLLHMHHNRIRGIDRDGETTCRLLARRAALAWLSEYGEATQ